MFYKSSPTSDPKIACKYYKWGWHHQTERTACGYNLVPVESPIIKAHIISPQKQSGKLSKSCENISHYLNPNTAKSKSKLQLNIQKHKNSTSRTQEIWPSPHIQSKRSPCHLKTRCEEGTCSSQFRSPQIQYVAKHRHPETGDLMEKCRINYKSSYNKCCMHSEWMHKFKGAQGENSCSERGNRGLEEIRARTNEGPPKERVLSSPTGVNAGGRRIAKQVWHISPRLRRRSLF